MSEITAEQVERAIGAAERCDARGVNAALGAFWYEREGIPAPTPSPSTPRCRHD